MKELKISTGEPFLAKVFGYSNADFNKVVQRSTTLYPVNDNVFLSEEVKDKRGHTDNDSFTFVFKVKNLYVESDSYSRSFIDRHPEQLIEGANKFAANYIDNINNLVKEKKHVQLLYIRVFDELGLDSKPLWAVREEREMKKKADNEQKALEREELNRQTAIKEEERIEKVRQQFIGGEEIDSDDFLTLCKKDGLDIHIRTKGTFNKSVKSLNIHGSIRYTYKSGKRIPKLNGCHDVINQYRELVTNKQ